MTRRGKGIAGAAAGQVQPDCAETHADSGVLSGDTGEANVQQRASQVLVEGIADRDLKPGNGEVARGDGWELRRGDCLALMAQLADASIDVTITDPPYEAEAHTLQRRQKGKITVVGREEFREVLEAPLTFDPITAEQRVEAAAQIARVTRHCALVFCQVEAVTAWRDALSTAGMAYRRCIPWLKPDAMPSLHGRWPGQSFEAIVLATKPGARPCPIGGKAVAYTLTRTNGSQPAPHETTKPLRLMRAMVEHFTQPGDLVLDAYAGSATTGVAAIQLGRRFLGFELAACARCAAPAEFWCSWRERKEAQSAYLCSYHRDLVSVFDAYQERRENYFTIATRCLRGDEAKPRPEQPGLFDLFASGDVG